MGVELVPLVTDHQQLAGLVGGDEERRAQAPQQRGEIRCVSGHERPGALRPGEGRIQRQADRGALVSQVFLPLCPIGAGAGRAR